MYNQVISKLRILLLLFSFVLPILLISKKGLAQNKTLYFMDLHPQSNLINPAWHADSSYFIFSPSVHSFVSNSSLTVNNLFTTKTIGSQSDLYWDFETIDKKLKDKNYLDAGVRMTPFFLGLKLKNSWYLNFSTSIVGISYINYPGTISLMRFGNANLETNTPRTIDLNNYYYNELTYSENSVGFSKKVNSKLSLGVNLKTLIGLSAIKTNHFLASVETEHDFSQSQLATDISVNVSGELFNADKVNNVFSSQKNFGKFLFGEKPFSFRNIGLAFDLGFSYQPNKKLEISGSILDIGLIDWGLEPQKLVSNDSYLFEGIYFSPYIVTEKDFSFNDYLEQYLDTITRTLIPEVENERFTTWLYPKIYLGVGYQYSPRINFNGLLNTVIYNDIFLINGTLGTNWLVNEKLALSGSISYSNYTLYNLGFGVSYKCDCMQVYFVTDNINAIDLRNSKSINFAVGLNILIWNKKSLDEII